MGQIPEASGGAAEVFQQPVDRFGGAVAGAGMIEVGQDVVTAFVHGSAEGFQLGQAIRNPAGDGVDEPQHDLLPLAAIVGFVGVDDVLVDTPSRLEHGMVLVAEHRQEPEPLLLGQKPGPGLRRAADAAERVAGAASVVEGFLLETLPALVEFRPGEGNDVEGVHHDGDLVDGLDSSAFIAGESVHRHHFHTVSELLGLGVEPGLEHLLRAALDHRQQT